MLQENVIQDARGHEVRDLIGLIQALIPVVLGVLTFRINFSKSSHDQLQDVVDRQKDEIADFIKRINALNKRVDDLEKENERLRNGKH